MKRVIIWVCAALLFINSLYITLVSHFTLLWLGAIALVVYGVFYKKITAALCTKKGRILKYAAWAGGLIFLAMFTFVAASGYRNSVQNNEQVIVVLGAGLRNNKPGHVLQARLDTAIQAHLQNPSALIVVSGGKGSTAQVSEAEAMRRYLTEHGIPKTTILMEDQSTSTAENMIFTRQLLQAHGISSGAPILIVTNGFHMYRSTRYAQAAGFTNVRTLAAPMPLPLILPAYTREVFAIVYHWVFRQ